MKTYDIYKKLDLYLDFWFISNSLIHFSSLSPKNLRNYFLTLNDLKLSSNFKKLFNKRKNRLGRVNFNEKYLNFRTNKKEVKKMGKSNDDRSNSMNPNNSAYCASIDNRSNQLNPNNEEYKEDSDKE